MIRQLVVTMWAMLFATALIANEPGSRAWQQRLAVEIPLPVPVVELAPSNPFSVALDTPPVLTGSVAPRKLDVAGRATAAAYVDTRGDCLGAVPLEVPFPGMTTPLVTAIQETRFEPAHRSSQPQPSWVVLEMAVSGRVKESSILDQLIELPDPGHPPQPPSAEVAYPVSRLQQLPATDSSELSGKATPRRLRFKVSGREVEVAVRALVHTTAGGRCDRFVPLELESGLVPWLSAFLATWSLEPARLDGQAVDAWVLYTARAQLKLSTVQSGTVHALHDREYSP